MNKLQSKKSLSRHASRISFLAVATLGTIAIHDAYAEDKTPVLGTVDVVGTAAPSYKPETANMGPLGEKPLLDTPYAINVVPAELLENQQLKSVREAFRYMPSVQGENIRPQTRGLQAGVVQNTRMDGMNIAATTDYPIEQFDRIEVLNGLAGALYGPASPAGTFNYVLKRPTETPLYRFNVAYASQGSASVSADISDRFGEDKRYGFRVNLLDEGGESYVDRSKLDRKFASLAFDVQLTNDTKLETNISRYHYTSKGLPGTFALGTNVVFPAAPDPKRVGYGQPFAGDDNVTETYSARIKHRLNQNWSLTAGVLKQSSDRASTVPTNTLTNNAGAYSVKVATTTYSLDEILSYTIALNGRVNTGKLTHDIVMSSTGFEWDRYAPYKTGAITLGTSNLNNPTIFNTPAFSDFKNRYKAQTTRQQAITVGDTIGFNEQWSAGLFLSQSWIDQSGSNSSGIAVPSAYYNDSGLSSNATVSYKPQKDMTIYASYADSLQQGETSGTTTLAPYRSKQWELGYKLAFEKMGFGAALFRVERPFAFALPGGVYAVQGDQRNQGLELTANGALTRNLTMYGGLTYLDPRLLNTATAATSNKQIMGLSRIVSNILLDYRIAAVPGLAVNLNVSHAGSRQGDNTNSYKVDGYTVADLGARYSTQLMGRPTTWRLAINNVTDERYWANITPNGQNGYTGAGAGTGTLGAPRTIRASMQIDF